MRKVEAQTVIRARGQSEGTYAPPGMHRKGVQAFIAGSANSRPHRGRPASHHDVGIWGHQSRSRYVHQDQQRIDPRLSCSMIAKGITRLACETTLGEYIKNFVPRIGRTTKNQQQLSRIEDDLEARVMRGERRSRLRKHCRPIFKGHN